MFKNIGKTIQILSFVLAALCAVGFILFGVLCILAAFEEGVTEALQKAGIQAAITCFVMALISPFLFLVLYGFGTLIITTQKQAQEAQKTREMLHAALADGLLSDEIARKTGIVFSKVMAQMPAQAPQQKQSARKEHAPVQRPVTEAVAPVAPVAPAAPVAPVAPVAPAAPAVVEEPAPASAQAAPVAPAPVVETVKEPEPVKAEPSPVKPAPAYARPITPRPATPIAGAKPIDSDEETF